MNQTHRNTSLCRNLELTSRTSLSGRSPIARTNFPNRRNTYFAHNPEQVQRTSNVLNKLSPNVCGLTSLYENTPQMCCNTEQVAMENGPATSNNEFTFPPRHSALLCNIPGHAPTDLETSVPSLQFHSISNFVPWASPIRNHSLKSGDSQKPSILEKDETSQQHDASYHNPEPKDYQSLFWTPEFLTKHDESAASPRPNLFYYKNEAQPLIGRPSHDQTMTFLKRKSMPYKFKVQNPNSKQESVDLQQVKKLEDVAQMQKAVISDDASSTRSSVVQKENEMAQQHLQRFLWLSTFLLAAIMLVLFAAVATYHFTFEVKWREQADRYGAQFGIAALFIALLGAYLLWARKKGPSGISNPTKCFLVGLVICSLAFFAFIYYEEETATFSLSILAAIAMTTLNTLALFTWSLPKRWRLPTVQSWITMLLGIMSADACIITTLSVHLQLPGVLVVFSWCVAMINFALMVALTRNLFRNIIFSETLTEDENEGAFPTIRKRRRSWRRSILRLKVPKSSLLWWAYLYPAITSYFIFVFVIIIYALLLNFPRIVDNFEYDSTPYLSEYNQA